jgi:hypothetical protein
MACNTALTTGYLSFLYHRDDFGSEQVEWFQVVVVRQAEDGQVDALDARSAKSSMAAAGVIVALRPATHRTRPSVAPVCQLFSPPRIASWENRVNSPAKTIDF